MTDLFSVKINGSPKQMDSTGGSENFKFPHLNMKNTMSNEGDLKEENANQIEFFNGQHSKEETKEETASDLESNPKSQDSQFRAEDVV